MSLLSARVQEVKPSPTLAITAKAKELKAAGQDVISLAGGEPDFRTPPHVCEAAHKAIDEGKHKYTAVDGIPELKKVIAAKLERENKLHYSLDQIIVSPGAKMVLYSAFMATLNPGDEVIIPAPYWVSYPDMVMLAGGKSVYLECPESQEFKLRPDQLDKAISKNTKWLIINSPNNPSGAVYSKKELEAIGEVLRKHPQVFIMTDDIYEYLVYDGVEFHTIAEVCPDLIDRTLTVNGASKAYAMTGWRLGYGAGPKPLIKAIETIQSQSTSNACSITQYAGVAALTGDQDYLKEWRKEYKHRRDVFVEKINEMDGLRCFTPHGAFYIFINCAGLLGKTTPGGRILKDDMEVTSFLLDDCQVAVTPGTVFGMSPYIRVTYATAFEEILRACDKMKAGIERLK